MSGHTPGPWHWSNEFKTSDGRKTWSLISDADGYGILACDGEENAPQGINDHANASLIAAAPELLSSTQMLLDVLDELSSQCDGIAEFQAPIRIARAVIAKATGEQP